MTDVTMPQLGETVTEGTITRWAKNIGDYVNADEVLFEVSTDKVDSEVPASSAGYLAEILVPEGETVDVGTRLAVITEEAPSGAAAPPPAAAAPPPAPPPAPEAAAPPAEAPPAEAPPAEAPPPEPPTAQAPPAEPVPVAEARPEPAAPSGDGLVLSPVVRRLLAEHDLDPAEIRGTGAGGRVTRDDVLAIIDARRAGTVTAPAPPAPAPAAAPPAPAPQPAPAPRPAPTARTGDREEIIPFSKIRRITAEHMVRSKQTSAHTVVVAEVDYDGVERVRQANRDAFRASEGTSLTYLPFISRAIVDAIEEFPHLNSSVGDDELIVHHYINLGIAVDLNFEGLLVPVIHDADGKRLRALAREIADLATRARTKRLTVDDLAGGTFTITNAGPFGTFLTIPVINQPQTAIIATDGVKKRPVAVELPDGTDAIAVHPVGNLALVFDHRAFDGAYAAAFVAKIKEILETRDWSQEL